MQKRQLFSTTMIAGLALLAAAGPTWAQEQGERPNVDVAAGAQSADPGDDQAPVSERGEAAGATEVGEIVVTGSRLRLPDYTQSAPVTSVSEEAIQFSGSTNLTDFLREVPALTSSFGSQDGADVSFGGSAGLNLLDLRNLGTQRTLVLVNGRRHVAGDGGTGAVDVNTIPLSMVQSVEVLTGGASATYGADAVSGVVNFILKDDFEGVDARAQYGVTEEGGGEDKFVSLTVGDNFSEDRGNITVNFEYNDVQPISRFDRDYSTPGRRAIYVENPNDIDDDPGVPDLVVSRDVRYPDTSTGGSVLTDTDFDDYPVYGYDFQGDGQPWRPGQPTAGFFVIGGSGSLTDEFEDELTPGLDRTSINSTFRFDLTPKHRVFAELKAVETNTAFTTQPTYDFGYGDFTFLGVYAGVDNPFMPASIRNEVAALGEDNIATAFFGLEPGVFVARDNVDLGYTNYEIDRQTYRGVFGFEGEIVENLDYEVSYVYGRTDEENIYRDARINERFFAAIDVVTNPATGQPVCRTNLDPTALSPNIEARTFGTTFTPGPNSGCVPANIFGSNISAAARDWINADYVRESRIEQQVLTGFLSGKSTPLFELPAGPISYAIGAEYREEKYRYRADELELLATEQAEAAAADGAELLYDLTWAGQSANSDGSYDVKEIFGEVSIPLLRDLPFADALTIDGAYRYSEYSLSGETETWKVGGLYRPTRDIMFRAATARAVRAPNISDLFQPLVQTSALLEDPCDADNVDAGTSTRRANCTTALAPFGLNPNTFQNTNTGSVEGRTGGNINLEPELADTFTAGLVFTPRFLPGFSASIDYYTIELENAIQLFTAQTIVDKCYDLPQPNNFCPLITRRAAAGTGNGFIDSFQRVALNVASYRTEGYDFTIRYRLDPQDFGVTRDIGDFQFDLVGNKLEDLTFTELVDADPDQDLGDPDAPEWQVVFDATWTYNNLTVNYGYSWYDKTLAFGEDEPNRFVNDPDYVDNRFYDERSIHDLQVRYALADGAYNVYAGVNNFTDQQPQFGFVDVPYVGPQGRFFYVGATARFGGS